ncbi:MAG: helix-turn-helix domain-containing protein [Bacteroidales bacterium]|nr:helix-turn-helix domain-containing protein [Bacteroidales bacterium]
METNKEKLFKIAEPRNEAEHHAFKAMMAQKKWTRRSKEIALAIKMLLREKGITQNEFAQKMGVTPGQISRMLSGETNFEIKTISKIEEALGAQVIGVFDDATLSNPWPIEETEDGWMEHDQIRRAIYA